MDRDDLLKMYQEHQDRTFELLEDYLVEFDHPQEYTPDDASFSNLLVLRKQLKEVMEEVRSEPFQDDESRALLAKAEGQLTRLEQVILKRAWLCMKGHS